MQRQIPFRTQLRRLAPALPPARPAPDTLLTTLHGLLLMLALPFAVLWIPLVQVQGTGTLTVLDCVLLLLVSTTLLRLLVTKSRTFSTGRALRIALYGSAPALFAVLGALLFDPQSRLTPEILQHAKRFGLPAIIPLAMLMAPAKYVPRIRVVAVVALLITVLIPFTPFADSLPLHDIRNDQSGGKGDERGSGSLSNPNDFAYISLLGALIGLSHAAGRRDKRFWRRWWATVAISAGLLGIVTSASRSGIAAALLAAAYIVFCSTLSFPQKLSLAGILGAALLVGWQVSAVYQDRMAMAMTENIREASTVARIEAQSVAFRTWLAHPLGVGFSNMQTATSEFSQHAQSFTAVTGSDSIYVDFLLGTGAVGFVCLILCFRNCWRFAGVRNMPVEGTYLKAGMLAAFCFGLATVSPASYSVAPFFFTAAGLAGCLRENSSLKEAGRV
jgi:hypothetical protein